MYIFETLLVWYQRTSRPDDNKHFNEIVDWAKRLIEKEASEKKRPILVERFNAIPLLTKGEITYITNPNPKNDSALLYGLFSAFTAGVGVMPKHELKHVLNKLKDCTEKMEKIIFLLTHEGIEDMMK
jgi:hypothetical protein